MMKIGNINVRRFGLSDQFIEQYRDKEVPWGPVGYITYKRTYARRLNEINPSLSGTEEWFQTCRRVIEGMFDIQKRHVFALGLEWNDAKAQRTAKEAYDRLFNLKWTPPGRGLWMMGTKFIYERTGAGLFNCAFRSTKDLSTWRGESDFQAFWFAYHKPIKEIPLTLPARLVFNELEMSRNMENHGKS